MPDDYGSTPLMYAARLGQLAAVEALCAAGADSNQLNAAGESAMVSAASFSV